MDFLHYLKEHNLTSFDEIKSHLSESSEIKLRDNDKYYLVYFPDPDPSNKLQRETQGVILEKDTNRIVCQCAPMLYQFPDKLPENCEWNSETTVAMCQDGSVIRVWKSEEKWHVSTSRCIDAYESSWSSRKSFGTLFDEAVQAIGMNFSELDPDYTYFFILCHPDNQIVTWYRTKFLMWLYRIHNQTGEINCESKPDSVLPQVDQTSEFSNFAEVKAAADKLPHDKPGYIVRINSRVRVKVENVNYTKAVTLRGNCKKLAYRYLELLQAKSTKELKEFESMFPNVNWVPASLNQLLLNLHQQYLNYYVYRQAMVISPHFRDSLNKLHEKYNKKLLEDSNYRTDHNAIRNYLDSLSTKDLYNLLHKDRYYHKRNHKK